jgi:hypothetical protein
MNTEFYNSREPSLEPSNTKRSKLITRRRVYDELIKNSKSRKKSNRTVKTRKSNKEVKTNLFENKFIKEKVRKKGSSSISKKSENRNFRNLRTTRKDRSLRHRSPIGQKKKSQILQESSINLYFKKETTSKKRREKRARKKKSRSVVSTISNRSIPDSSKQSFSQCFRQLKDKLTQHKRNTRMTYAIRLPKSRDVMRRSNSGKLWIR